MKSPIIIGNHSRGFKTHGFDGQRGFNLPVGMGWCSVVGESGDTCVIQLTSLTLKDVNQGVYFQSTVPVSVEYSLANPGPLISQNPTIRNAGPWSPAQTVAPGNIVKADWPIFTAIKVTLNGDGALYIGVL